MTKFNPVRRSAYKSLSQEALTIFAGNVFNRMSAAPEYQSMATSIQDLDTKTEAFISAMEQAKDRSIYNISAKNKLYAELIAALDRMVILLMVDYTGDDAWFTNAGFVAIKNRQRSQIILEAPKDLEVIQKGQSGEVVLKFKVPAPNQVVTNAVEYSYDNGETWNNGTYGNGRKGVVLSGLMVRQEILVKVRSLGRADRKSAWTNPVLVYLT